MPIYLSLALAIYSQIILKEGGLTHFVVGFILGLGQGLIVCDWLRDKFSSKQAQTGSKKLRKA